MKEKTIITEKIGLYGWENLEPVLLAALASELPMLLVGKHGSAKSFILEKLSKSLKLNYRFYNASLINYDDLVGIPIPIENNTKLSYISNDNSIWDAEVVFIDEINRTKAELQNKLFPIIYDKRVQGINLNKLKYRWAAMNPPYVDEEENDLEYFGTSQLDPALADRFAFILNVPSWDELSNSDKKNMFKDLFKGEHEIDVDINSLIKETKEMFFNLNQENNKYLSDYIITLMELLKNKYGYLSARRASTLYETFIYIYASEVVIAKHLNKPMPDYSDIACIHVLNTLPFIASIKQDEIGLLNIALEAIKISKLEESKTKDLLLMDDPINKIKHLLNNIGEIDSKTMNEIIPTSLEKIELHKRKTVALALYLKLRNNKNLDASIMETIILEVSDLFSNKRVDSIETLKYKKFCDKVDVLMSDCKDKNKIYIENILRVFLPHNYNDEQEIIDLFNFSRKFLNEVNING